ncbi:nucleotidyltransferase [Roseomonas sp. BN140053]|uniref:nucleotidyltransferase domain-containing protein n=1 Tax=Roseomonas sp. BN140053 TaxID=3391898 RepID=UPI0039ECBD0D
MNDLTRIAGYPTAEDPLANPLDALLADIAISVQLPPGLHAKACSRKDSVQAFLQREGSPLRGLVARFYPQGSMAIDATISTRGTDDEYDLDLVAELLVPPGTPPAVVMELLWLALKDYPVEGGVTRQTRCVTIHYADGMHLDVTPSRRLPFTDDFASVIFHAKPDEPPARHAEVPMNAFGFAEWFKQRTPVEDRFSASYNTRLLAFDTAMKAEAEVHEVPEQVPLPRKSVTTVGLQLVKRFRNIWSSTREGRYPPSVMLSCHAGYAAQPGMRLSDMVVRQARWTAKAIDEAEARGKLVDVRNPKMTEDRFTDRWPENHGQQGDFAAALHGLADVLEHVSRTGAQLEDLQEWLRGCFGPLVVSRSVKALNDRNGRALRSGTHGYTRSGGLLVPAAPALVGAASPAAAFVAPRRHTNMGERRP